MNLLSSLEKFGFSMEDEAPLDITKEPGKDKPQDMKESEKEPEKEPEEKDFLVRKHISCPVCSKRFDTLTVRGTRAKRLEPDYDLRPRFAYIDTLKYDVTLCPQCGYAAMNRFFSPLSDAQVGRIKKALDGKFKPQDNITPDTYSLQESIDRYKLALVSSMAKIVKLSEKSYICLKIAWLIRDEIKEVKALSTDEAIASALQQEYNGFYKQAYNGFLQCMSKETPPFCGINASTLTFMIANMAMYFRDYAVASKYVYELIGSKTASPKVKDRCLTLKDQIAAKMREEAKSAKKA